jgi:LDH2 family malate/lactate/ureidoglycolate dehydrogenase
MAQISFPSLVRFAREFLVRKGASEANAGVVAEAVVSTEAFGITTHGLAFLPYAEGAIPGLIDPRAEPVVAAEGGAVAVLDGRRCFGQLAMHRAVELALQKASAFGIAMVSVRDTGWLAALGVQLLPLAERGMLAELWAQTNTCEDCAPVGGVDGRFSTNPVALAIPTDADPILVDFATSAISMGATKAMAKRGARAPERVFMDRDGNLSDDPNVVTAGGTILFLGGEHFGHKGYGLSLWCEALTAASGGECNNPGSRTQQNFTLEVIDPGMLGGRPRYLEEMSRFVRHVKSSRPRAANRGVRLPGERGLAALRAGKRDGVPVDDGVLAKLNELAAKVGIEAVR